MPVLFVSQQVAERYVGDLERLGKQSAAGPLEVLVLPTGGTLDDAAAATIDAAFVSVDMVNPTMDIRTFLDAMQRAPNLRWMHIGWAGTDSPFVQQFMDRNVTVSNSSGVTSEPIALSVIGGMLALYRGFPRWFDLQRRHIWEQSPQPDAPPDLRGQTLVVLGLGAIGGHVARFARALGLYVIGVRRTPATAADDIDEWAPPEKLLDVLARTDWLVVTLPSTAATRQLIDAAAIAAMPRGARIINVARGAIIDEKAMVEALVEGHLGGAYLDVFETEPLPVDSPLWNLPNVIVSPHDSHPSKGNNARAEAIFFEELGIWLSGRQPSRVVQER